MINELSLDLKKAKAKIYKNRLLAWCSNEGESSVDKITLLPLTAKAWVDLNVIDNKFICGGDPTNNDIMEYLWRNSDKYNANSSRKTNKAKKQIGYLFAQSKPGEFSKIVYEHIYAAFEEFPQSNNVKSDSVKRTNSIAEIDGIVGMIDEVASRYGQNPAIVLNWSLNRIFQLQKAIRLATIPNYKLAEPKLIKMIKQEILQELNNGTESRP
jgi:hypothetical protein